MPAPLNVRRRSSYAETMDDFPTAPWVVRAILEQVVDRNHAGGTMVSDSWDLLRWYEPACGRGHIVRTLEEQCQFVRGEDIVDYGNNKVSDYLKVKRKFHIGMTNPPFALAEQFARKMLQEAEFAVGLFVKSSFAESISRHALFMEHRPTSITILSKRMPGAKNRVVQSASAYLSHSFFWWDKTDPEYGKRTLYDWFAPDTQQKFERPEDYL